MIKLFLETVVTEHQIPHEEDTQKQKTLHHFGNMYEWRIETADVLTVSLGKVYHHKHLGFSLTAYRIKQREPYLFHTFLFSDNFRFSCTIHLIKSGIIGEKQGVIGYRIFQRGIEHETVVPLSVFRQQKYILKLFGKKRMQYPVQLFSLFRICPKYIQ